MPLKGEVSVVFPPERYFSGEKGRIGRPLSIVEFLRSRKDGIYFSCLASLLAPCPHPFFSTKKLFSHMQTASTRHIASSANRQPTSSEISPPWLFQTRHWPIHPQKTTCDRYLQNERTGMKSHICARSRRRRKSKNVGHSHGTNIWKTREFCPANDFVGLAQRCDEISNRHRHPPKIQTLKHVLQLHAHGMLFNHFRDRPLRRTNWIDFFDFSILYINYFWFSFSTQVLFSKGE